MIIFELLINQDFQLLINNRLFILVKLNYQDGMLGRSDRFPSIDY